MRTRFNLLKNEAHDVHNKSRVGRFFMTERLFKCANISKLVTTFKDFFIFKQQRNRKEGIIEFYAHSKQFLKKSLLTRRFGEVPLYRITIQTDLRNNITGVRVVPEKFFEDQQS